MQIQINGGPDDWKKWGDLVRSWVFDHSIRPNSIAELKDKIHNAGINATVPSQYTSLQFVDYHDGILNISLPTQKMVSDDETKLHAIAAKPQGQRHYPLPNFYAIAFGLASEVDLSDSVMLDFGRQRLGEYTIEECQ
jgi:hypothetical protein